MNEDSRWGVELASKAAVDLENVSKKLSHQDTRTDLIGLLENLPNNSQLVWRDERTLAIDVTIDQLESLHTDILAQSSTLKFEALLPRDEEILRSEALNGTVEELLSSVCPAISLFGLESGKRLRGGEGRDKAAKEEAGQKTNRNDNHRTWKPSNDPLWPFLRSSRIRVRD